MHHLNPGNLAVSSDNLSLADDSRNLRHDRGDLFAQRDVGLLGGFLRVGGGSAQVASNDASRKTIVLSDGTHVTFSMAAA
ncbi:MAG: hypothetical protein P4L71_01415 [Acetobacteraceae bacterium]|nr:hypothetical protein [Acetobacteraceae bacterium]